MDVSSRVGEVVGERFRIVSELGRGGGGITFEAEPVEGGPRVALKELDLRGVREWKTLELFEREARALHGLAHPRVPRYVAHFRIDAPEGPVFYLAHELVPGRNLAELVAQGLRPTEHDVKRIATDLLDVLTFLHAQNPPMIHRDLKPENIVRRDDGAIFLVDFGGVRDSLRTTSGGSTVVGTFGYMAPEQFRGVALPATDLYGLGATLLFLLTGRSPADLPHERLRVDVKKATRVSAGLCDWLQTLLEPAPEDRFATAKDALTALRKGRGKEAKAHPIRLAVLAVLLFSAGGVTLGVLRHQAKLRYEAAMAAASRPWEVLPERPPRDVLLDGLGTPRSTIVHVSGIFDLAYSPDGQTLFSASNDGAVKAWKVSDLSAIRAFAGHEGRVGAVAITPDGATLVTAGDDGTWRTFDVATGKPKQTIEGGSKVLSRVAVHPNGDVVATAGFDGNAKTWVRSTGALLKTFPHSPGVRLLSVAFSPDGKKLVTAGDDKNVKVWDADTGAPITTFTGNTKAVDRAVVGPDGQTIVSAGDDGTIRAFSLRSGHALYSDEIGGDEVWSVAFAPAGDVVVAGTKKGHVALWTPLGGKRVAEGYDQPTSAVAFAPDGSTFATGAGSGLLRVWSARGSTAPFAMPAANPSAPDVPVLAGKGPKEQTFCRAWDALSDVDPRTARNAIDALDKLDPDYTPTLVLRARLALREGYISHKDYRPGTLEAVDKFLDRAIARDPRFLLARVERAQLRLIQTRVSEAATCLEEARAIDPDAIQVKWTAADVDLARGDIDAAEKESLSVLDKSSHRQDVIYAYDHLLDVYRERHDWRGMDAAYLKLIEVEPELSWHKGNFTAFLDQRGDYDRAIAMGEATLKQQDYGIARLALAKALTHKGEKLLWDESDQAGAKALFERAIATFPKHAPAYYGLGAYYRWFAVTQRARGALEPSRKAFEQASKLDPQDPRAARALVEHARVVALVENDAKK